ncbi:MAG: cation transporter, partial [Ktedonobacteraceae bacterium]
MKIETGRDQAENSATSSDEIQITQQILFALEGMTCASCAMRIEKGLKKVSGVQEATVNLASEQATVIYDPAQTDVTQLVQKVDAVGYKAIPKTGSSGAATGQSIAAVSSDEPAASSLHMSPADEQRQRRQAELARKLTLLLLGIVLTVPVLILNMFFMNRFAGENLLLLVLTTPVWALVGWEFHRGALKTARHLSANMDTLISLGSTAAYLLSVVATFLPQALGATTFYDTAALIVTLIFLGKYLEARA